MKKQKESAAMQVMNLVWSNSSRNSWPTLNSEMYHVLRSLINLDFEFGETDYANIDNLFRGHFWLGVSLNGNHRGEGLYATGTKSYNNSFCVSYEKHTGRIPFILGTNRVHEGYEFLYKGLCCKITGWVKDNTTIKAVGYKNRMWTGKRTLFTFDREKWLAERKEMKAI